MRHTDAFRVDERMYKRAIHFMLSGAQRSLSQERGAYAYALTHIMLACHLSQQASFFGRGKEVRARCVGDCVAWHIARDGLPQPYTKGENPERALGMVSCGRAGSWLKVVTVKELVQGRLARVDDGLWKFKQRFD